MSFSEVVLEGVVSCLNREKAPIDPRVLLHAVLRMRCLAACSYLQDDV